MKKPFLGKPELESMQELSKLVWSSLVKQLSAAEADGSVAELSERDLDDLQLNLTLPSLKRTSPRATSPT